MIPLGAKYLAGDMARGHSISAESFVFNFSIARSEARFSSQMLPNIRCPLLRIATIVDQDSGAIA